MGRYQDKGVLVTGAGVGIGYEICRQFAVEGAYVALNDIDADLARKAAASINQEVGREAVYAYGFDVADLKALRAMVSDLVSRVGRVDVAVANAGLTNFGEFLTYTPEAFDRVMAVNLRGSFFTAQYAALEMIDKQISGRILLMSSITGGQSFLNLAAYGVTKAGVRHMAKVLALELGRHDITINAISPGLTITERTLQDDPNAEANWAEVTPMRRTGHVEDIAAAALFLASPEARHITGQTLEVDGGWTTVSPMPSGHPAKPEFSSRLK